MNSKSIYLLLDVKPKGNCISRDFCDAIPKLVLDMGPVGDLGGSIIDYQKDAVNHMSGTKDKMLKVIKADVGDDMFSGSSLPHLASL